MITNIWVTNYKSFDHLNLDLGPLCVLVGANASGKTNFIDIFRFIQDALKTDVPIAVHRRLGARAVKCRARRYRTTDFYLELTPTKDDFELHVELLGDPPDTTRYTVESFSYNCLLKHQPPELVVAQEHFQAVLKPHPGPKEDSSRRRKVQFVRKGLKVKQQPTFLKEDLDLAAQTINSLFLGQSPFSTAASKLADIVKQWAFYHIDPTLARVPAFEEPTPKLSERADNLALLLGKLSRTEDRTTRAAADRLRALMQSMVPGFQEWITEHTYDGRVSFRVREAGFKDLFPAPMLSDGTVMLLALLVALIPPSDTLETIFIEEPERSIHPQLLEDLVHLMREVSKSTQVIVTTHSPDLVRHLVPNEVYLVDKIDRVTRILRASSIQQVDQFLKEFSMDELWLQGYLQSGLPI